MRSSGPFTWASNRGQRIRNSFASWEACIWAFAHRPLKFVAIGTVPPLLPLGVLCATTTIAARNSCGRALWSGTLAAWAAAVAKGKGFSYHYWPAIGLAFLFLVAVWPLSRLLSAPIAIAWLIGVVHYRRYWERTAAGGCQIGRPHRQTLSTRPGCDSGSCMAPYERVWPPVAFTEYCFWWLVGSKGQETVTDFTQWRNLDHPLRMRILSRVRPDVILLGVGAVDVSAYLGRSPAWSALLAQYRAGEVEAGYRVSRRRQWTL